MKEQEIYRLQEIRNYLGVSAKPNDPIFEREVVAASRSKLKDIYGQPHNENGERFVETLATHLNITFEEVHDHSDVTRLQDKYLKQHKEIAFGQLELELQGNDVDALLFKRQNDPGKYVAVLNLQDTNSRAYWNKSHEMTHRLIEPPQQPLFHRHRANQKNTVENLVDLVAAEIAFYEPIFRPVVESYSREYLTWSVIERIRNSFAPSASLISIARATVRYWPYPVFLIQAAFRGRIGNSSKDQALRASLVDRNILAEKEGIFFYTNMRVPVSSPIAQTFTSGIDITERESLSKWVTSRGEALPRRNAITSAHSYRNDVLALMSPI